jgi:hypothetical protein
VTKAARGTDPGAVRSPDRIHDPEKVNPMSILKSLRPRKRAVVALATLAASLGAVTVGGAIGAPTASAARCATAGHGYLTQPGRTIFSGFEGNQQFGVPTVTYAQGTQSFGLGGNGISPGSGVDFFVFDRNTGAQVGFVPGRPAQYYTSPAGRNCVVNENGPFTFTLPPGNYRVQANYFPGNYFRLVTDVVANLDVLPAPPPPPPNPCFGVNPDICFGF